MKFLHFNVVLHPKSSPKTRKKYQSRTVAVTPVSAEEIMTLVQAFMTAKGGELPVTTDIGVTFLSLKDRYSKKEGRAEAIKRMKSVGLTVQNVNISSTHIFVQLSEYHGVTLLLRLNKSSGYSTVTGSLTVGETSDSDF